MNATLPYIDDERHVLAGYQRQDYPVLTYILDGIIREEARRMRFYEGIAALRLQRASPLERKFIRYLVERTLQLVGTGISESLKTRVEVTALLRFLLGNDANEIRMRADDKIARSPGFGGFAGLSTRIQAFLDNAS